MIQMKIFFNKTNTTLHIFIKSQQQSPGKFVNEIENTTVMWLLIHFGRQSLCKSLFVNVHTRVTPAYIFS